MVLGGKENSEKHKEQSFGSSGESRYWWWWWQSGIELCPSDSRATSFPLPTKSTFVLIHPHNRISSSITTSFIEYSPNLHRNTPSGFSSKPHSKMSDSDGDYGDDISRAHGDPSPQWMAINVWNDPHWASCWDD
jgi:hypothetical protein